MPAYNYYNQVGNKVATTAEINMIRRGDLLSLCGAVEISDQHGCKYREDASNAEHCVHWRESFGGACDCVWAQRGIAKPKGDKSEKTLPESEIIPT